MKISELIKDLKYIKAKHGDIEVTCTASTLKDGHGGLVPDVYESTVENLIVIDNDTSSIGKRVRIYF